MYSVVLMMAVTGGAEAPDFGGRRNGCNGGAVYACSGVGGYACSGGVVHGGGFGGCTGAVVYTNGCSGFGYACSGSHGCSGRRGLFGGGLFGRRHGCQGNGYACSGYACSGFGYACSGGVVIGGYGCAGGAIVGPGCHGGIVVPPTTDDGKGKDKMPPAKTSTEAPATILVTIPADGKLTIDGAQTVSTGSERRFVSPSLAVGREYSYTLTAEINQNGQTVRTSQTVTVRGGEETRVSFVPTTATASR